MDSLWASGAVPEADPDAWANDERPKQLQGVHGEGWVIVPSCGDCEGQDVYLFGRSRIVVLSFLADAASFEGRELARQDFRRMLASFRRDR
jgi:hypothetical protein